MSTNNEAYAYSTFVSPCQSIIGRANFGHSYELRLCPAGMRLKYHRLFRPKISKVKRRFVVEIREVSNGFLTPNVGVSDYTPV